jgi:phospholipid/cholesterol/gamma-HCH transport system substrate-binding protein
MEPRANYALIGAFVLLAGVAVLGFVLWLGQSQFRESFNEYDIVFDGPVTLDDAASVRYIGIKVGEVRWVRIDRANPSKVRARIRIDAETPVKTDSTATIDFAGITGITFIQINAGKPDAPPLTRQPGQPVPVIEAERTQLFELINSSRRILGQTTETAEQVNALLSDENIEHVSAILANMDRLSGQLAREGGIVADVEATLESLDRASQRFGAASDDLSSLGREAETRIAALGPMLEDLSGELDTTLGAITRAAETGERTASGLSETLEGPGVRAMEDLAMAAQDLRRLTTRLDRLARELEQNPQRIVVGNPLPYEESRP